MLSYPEMYCSTAEILKNEQSFEHVHDIYNFRAKYNDPLLSAVITVELQYYMSLQVFFHASPHISSLLLIGYGHLAPKTQSGRLFLIFFALFGIPLNLLTLQSVGEHINYGIHLIIKYFEKAVLKKETPTHQHIKCFAINLLLITLWLPLGGIMYFYSEKTWTFLDSVYYCFVALSTIGFGDLVPNEGKEPNSSYEQGMWIVRLMYLGMGLSLLSSVFTSVCSAAKQIQSLMPRKRGMA